VNIVLFCHSLLSDWNHGNAHYLRGVTTELQSRGCRVHVFEPRDAWSAVNLMADYGPAALEATRAAYPGLDVVRYDRATLDLDEALDGADLVIVHEWSEHDLVAAIGRHHCRVPGYVLLFHDTHHRSVSNPPEMAAYDLREYDGVLAFGEVIRQRYLKFGWAARAWTWREAADLRVFAPHPDIPVERDLIWIGNWGDNERAHELREYLVEPVRALRLDATVHGVRYPEPARAALIDAGIRYEGWLPNYRVPQAFARHRITIHIPRGPYVRALPGIPTIRPFEALACGIPLVSAPWDDTERLFRPGVDYLVARTGAEMRRHLRALRYDGALAQWLAVNGRERIASHHTCAHRVDQLFEICAEARSTRAERIPA
jgi:spore maturation protein CgeB